jgi:cation diffusion facilitator family transporter
MAGGSSGSAAKAILYAFLANFGIALSKLGAAFYTGSGSMMAESIHSFADSGNQVLLYIGMRAADRPADENHPLGYGKLSYFWSFIVAIVLFSLGGLFSIYEGWHKWHEPEPLNQVWVALAVLGGAIVLECGSLWGCMREVNLMRGDKPFRRWLRETRNAEIVVVLGEDIAAIVGLVLAFGFLSLAWSTGDPVYDAWGSMTIGVVLIIVALFLVVRIQGLLVGKSAEPELRELLEKLIDDDPSTQRVFNTITIQFGPKVMLAAKVEMAEGLRLDEAIEHINLIEARVKEEHPEIGWCFIEPDVED